MTDKYIKGVEKMDILQSIVTAAPYMMKILKDEVTMGVIDREKFLLYLPSKDMDFQIRTGDPIKPDDQNMKNALRGKTSSTFVPESVYGTLLNAMGLPIFDENQIELETYMESLNDIIQSIREKVHVVVAHSEELSATSEEMTLQTWPTLESSKKLQILQK